MNPSQGGWIKLYRGLEEKGYYRKSQYVHLWIHLLLSANHKPKEYMTNGKIILIKEGQLVTGRKQLAEATGIPESTIEDIMRLLENEQQIRQQKTTKYRLITIVNWKEYQESDNKATTKQQQADTNKNVRMKEDTSEAELRVEIYSDSDKPAKSKVPPKYPNARTVFGWFRRSEPSWTKNTTECVHAEMLFNRGEKNVKAALSFAEKHRDDIYCPKINKPSDLERKWVDLQDYADRHES